jgi:phosphocarrier protein HPr
MRAKAVEIVNPTGLHARPGTAFVKRARDFQSAIMVIKGDRRGNGKSLLSLLKVGISMGDHVIIEADGPDEDFAVDALVELVASFED